MQIGDKVKSIKGYKSASPRAHIEPGEVGVVSSIDNREGLPWPVGVYFDNKIGVFNEDELEVVE